MEDEFGVAYYPSADGKDLEYAYFGIFDGHGGSEAAQFAKEHLMDYIVSQKSFWEEDDDQVLKAIHEGFIQTHYAMWKELEKWPKTASGLPSTAGTTASIAFIRRGKIYIGHVGDSAIILGEQDPDNPDIWRAEPLTTDHKPESLEESSRIQQCGGKVVCKSGVPRVVWNRPRVGHKGPVRRSTHIDEIPFLAVARSLGDLWSYNSEENVFVVSPEPDLRVYNVDITKHRCLILGTDGAWNMLTAQNAMTTVCRAEKSNEQNMLNHTTDGKPIWINPSKQLVEKAIGRWNSSKLRADNTTVVTVMLDPPGPPREKVLKRRRELGALNAGTVVPSPPGDRGSVALVTNTTNDEAPAAPTKTGCSIISRFPNSSHPVHSHGVDLVAQKRTEAEQPETPRPSFQGCTGRLSDSTLVINRPNSNRSTSPAAIVSTPEDKVQVNEVSSSEDSPSRIPATAPTTTPLKEISPLPSSSNTKKSRGQAVEASTTPRTTRGSTTRARTSSENHSDSENVVAKLPAPTKTPKKSISFVKQRCKEINEAVEAEKRPLLTPRRRKHTTDTTTDTSHNLRSASKATPRSLRSKGGTPVAPRSDLKRKLAVFQAVSAKSPKVVTVKKPVVRRSRQATVLKLKK